MVRTIVMLSLLLTACGSSDPAATPDPIIGTWTGSVARACPDKAGTSTLVIGTDLECKATLFPEYGWCSFTKEGAVRVFPLEAGYRVHVKTTGDLGEGLDLWTCYLSQNHEELSCEPDAADDFDGGAFFVQLWTRQH